jgi:hypothetical protein
MSDGIDYYHLSTFRSHPLHHYTTRGAELSCP